MLLIPVFQSSSTEMLIQKSFNHHLTVELKINVNMSCTTYQKLLAQSDSIQLDDII